MVRSLIVTLGAGEAWAVPRRRDYNCRFEETKVDLGGDVAKRVQAEGLRGLHNKQEKRTRGIARKNKDEEEEEVLASDGDGSI